MYPQTTSLYSATVVDSTTYCRDDDDIIVVDFDGEEPGTSCASKHVSVTSALGLMFLALTVTLLGFAILHSLI